MKYRELEYSRTFNLGDYQSERITLMIDLDETEDLDESFKTLKAAVFKLQQEGGLIEESRKVAEAENISLENVVWTKTEGPSGSYEKATDQNNRDYALLLKDLKAHDGKITKNGFFIWLFSDNKTIGRKPSKR